MALDFGGDSTQVVDHGTGSSVNNIATGSVLLSAYMDGVAPAADQRFWAKSTGGGRFFGYIRATSGDLHLERAGSGAATSCRVTQASLAAFGVSKWLWLLFTWDRTGATAPHIYCCDTTGATGLVEASSYVTQTTGGTGAGDDSASAMRVGGNQSGSPGNSLDGKIATFRLFTRVLSLAEADALTREPKLVLANCVLDCHYGFNGTGSQPDWSGNGNTGTVTGATVADHPPVRLWRPRMPRLVAAAAGGPVEKTASDTIVVAA